MYCQLIVLSNHYQIHCNYDKYIVSIRKQLSAFPDCDCTLRMLKDKMTYCG